MGNYELILLELNRLTEENIMLNKQVEELMNEIEQLRKNEGFI